MRSYNDILLYNIVNNEPKNLIVYGSPGTGKSWGINNKAMNLFGSDNLFKRVTFYSQYSYNQFVGGYKPIPIYRDLDKVKNIIDSNGNRTNKEPIISYEYVPGPFLEIILKAINNKDNNYLMIIEEINRGEAASIFGDFFQILDRDITGNSEYRVMIENELKEYIMSTDIDLSIKNDICNKGIYLPRNLYIWSTMNSADQGVFPLDSAFKRRWSFEYIGIDDNESEMDSCSAYIKGIGDIKWNVFRHQINNVLIEKKVNEDKLIGPFFLKKEDFQSEKSFETAFINKVIMYLCEDCFRYKKELIFKNKTLTEIIKKYKDKTDNDSIFNFQISTKI
ncbi:AAA family ATPase [Clostridium sporogenes]|uniref:AAA family ATPase n=1 Tax=Clostridium sporogenes TaxID=1509 RepID=UPI0006684368|nr:AAA family ATPase [Clostridium sporogenes]NFT38915.1 restriction endonuclease [Clostridium sporogenes]NFT53632.1 restriction endonuclease [Clostridium sporogenes]NFT74048.1 restriction endonuclease [Clostridium sporogenes]